MSGLANTCNCIIIKTIMKKIKLSKFLSFIELNCLCNNLFGYIALIHKCTILTTFIPSMHLHYCVPSKDCLRIAFNQGILLLIQKTNNFEIFF